MNLNDINIKEQKIVTEDEIKNMQGITYDVCGDDDDDVITSLPNANDILDDVIKLLECMNTEEMKTLKGINQGAYEQALEDKFPEFSYNYYSVFKMILSGDDITPLFKMLEMISDVNTGKSNIEECEQGVGKYLSKFLPDGLLEKLENEQIAAMNGNMSGNMNVNTQNNKKNKKNKKYGKK